MVERFLGKKEVESSILSSGSGIIKRQETRNKGQETWFEFCHLWPVACHLLKCRKKDC